MNDGFLLLDKKKGETSFYALSEVKRFYKTKHAGHCGTLDPLATGLLIIGINQGTKLIEYLVGLDKEYEVLAEFGKVSDSYDADGKIEEMNKKIVLKKSAVDKAIKDKFLGEILQMPPVFSALKINGKRACDLVREGKEVKLKERKVHIYSFKVIEFSWPFVKFKVCVSSGTYIRSLIHDLGQDLKCGAIVSELRRNLIGDFDVKNADMKKLIFVDEIMKKLNEKFEKISVNENEYEALKKGQIVMSKKVEQGEGIAMAFLNDKFIGVVENSRSNNGIKFKKMIVF